MPKLIYIIPVLFEIGLLAVKLRGRDSKAIKKCPAWCTSSVGVKWLPLGKLLTNAERRFFFFFVCVCVCVYVCMRACVRV